MATDQSKGMKFKEDRVVQNDPVPQEKKTDTQHKKLVPQKRHKVASIEYLLLLSFCLSIWAASVFPSWKIVGRALFKKTLIKNLQLGSADLCLAFGF